MRKLEKKRVINGYKIILKRLPVGSSEYNWYKDAIKKIKKGVY